MCGIVGYIGYRPAAPLIVNSLKRLEYRGYDSAGVCEFNGCLATHKTKGRIADLESLLGGVQLMGRVGIGHTRWATHGEPSDNNAHPHTDCTGRISVVHNGIIENYKELQQSLVAKGHSFRSETDTEVISHLVEENYQGDLLRAVQQTVKVLKGSYAMVAISENEPERLVAARKDSPLIIGLGEEENFVASDIPAILEYTRDIVILEDGDVAVLTAAGVECYDTNLHMIHKQSMQVTWDPQQAEKEGYEDFMLKEIHEQVAAVRDTIAGRIDEQGGFCLDSELPRQTLVGIERVQMVACGTAYHACLYGKHLLEEYLDFPVEVDLASEYRYKRIRASAATLMVVVSQSGETADTLGAMRLAKAKGATILAVTNVVGSTLAREADAVLFTHAGPEIAVASTKAYTTQLACLCIIAGYLRQVVTGEVDKALNLQLRQIPQSIESVLQSTEPFLRQYAARMRTVSDTFFLGRGLDYASAMEGQLKLKEISYIHGEALAGGELKHGTLALVEPGVPLVALLTQPTVADKMVSNLKEVKARGGGVLGISVNGLGDFSDVADELLLLPDVDPMLAPILTAVPLQLLAYYTAKERGCDVDKPRNLAKSVTVE